MRGWVILSVLEVVVSVLKCILTLMRRCVHECLSVRQVDGTLTTKNAGGNHTHPTYMLNPQWHLRIYDENAGSSGMGAFTSNGKALPLRGFMGNSKVAGMSGKSKTRQKSVVVLSGQGPREVPLNVTVVWSSGERIIE